MDMSLAITVISTEVQLCMLPVEEVHVEILILIFTFPPHEQLLFYHNAQF